MGSSTSASTSTSAPLGRRAPRAVAAALVLLAVGFGLYARTLGYEFVNWDDPEYVVQNPWIRGASLEHLGAIWSRGILGGYLPVHLLSYLFDHAWWGLDPWGYHLHSIVLNALNGALAFWVVARLSRRLEIAFVAALLFTLHHSHVESVAWISARKELLFTAFLLLSTVAYCRARRDSVFHRPAYAASIALFTLGMLSKTTISTFPLFFLLVDWAEDARLPAERRRSLAFHLRTKLPYVAVAGVLVGANLLTQVAAGDPLSANPQSYALVKGQAGWGYVLLLLSRWPGQPIYDPPPISLHPFFAALTLAPLLVPPVLLGVALRRGHANTALALGWLIAGLVPPIVFPLITFMADRYLYAPSLGFCWLLAIGIAALADTAQRSPAWRWAVFAAFTALPALWFVERTWLYTPVWRDSESLWTYAMTRSRDGRAAVGLAGTLREQRRFEEAARVLEQTEVPGPKGYLNLAIIYAQQDRLDAALRAGDQALRLLEESGEGGRVAAQVHTVRGAVLWKLERAGEAIDAWQRALAADPDNPTAREMLDRARRGGSS